MKPPTIVAIGCCTNQGAVVRRPIARAMIYRLTTTTANQICVMGETSLNSSFLTVVAIGNPNADSDYAKGQTDTNAV